MAALVLVSHACGGLPGPLSYWARPIVLEFVLGMGIAVAHRGGVRLSTPAALALLAAAAAEFTIWASVGDVFLYRWLSAGLPAAQAVAALALLRRDVVVGWVDRIGDASYALYLTHPVVIAVARILAQKGYFAAGGAVPLSRRRGRRQHRAVPAHLRARRTAVDEPGSMAAGRAAQGTMPPRNVGQT